MLELAEGTLIAGRFRLLRELGRGGMGAVWVAHHTSLDVTCAIKFILGEAAHRPDIRARFEREAKAAALLKSSHVVQILDHGIHDGTPYIAMELLEGEDLRARIDRMGRLGATHTIFLLNQVARALTKAHAAGIVHRDLKPENLFLVREDDREIVKILDFGIAKMSIDVQASAQTKTGAVLGSPFYMSPEQAQALKTIDHRSDLWSLAVIAFRCLTGVLPFEADSLYVLMAKIVVEPLPVPSVIAPDLPPAVDRWWARAAARNPAERFDSAKQLMDGLALAFGMSLVEPESAPITHQLPSQVRPSSPGGSAHVGLAVARTFSHTRPGTRNRNVVLGIAGGSLLALGIAAFAVRAIGPHAGHSAAPTSAAAAEVSIPAATAGLLEPPVRASAEAPSVAASAVVTQPSALPALPPQPSASAKSSGSHAGAAQKGPSPTASATPKTRKPGDSPGDLGF